MPLGTKSDIFDAYAYLGIPRTASPDANEQALGKKRAAIITLNPFQTGQMEETLQDAYDFISADILIRPNSTFAGVIDYNETLKTDIIVKAYPRANDTNIRQVLERDYNNIIYKDVRVFNAIAPAHRLRELFKDMFKNNNIPVGACDLYRSLASPQSLNIHGIGKLLSAYTHFLKHHATNTPDEITAIIEARVFEHLEAKRAEIEQNPSETAYVWWRELSHVAHVDGNIRENEFSLNLLKKILTINSPLLQFDIARQLEFWTRQNNEVYAHSRTDQQISDDTDLLVDFANAALEQDHELFRLENRFFEKLIPALAKNKDSEKAANLLRNLVAEGSEKEDILTNAQVFSAEVHDMMTLNGQKSLAFFAEAVAKRLPHSRKGSDIPKEYEDDLRFRRSARELAA